MKSSSFLASLLIAAIFGLFDMATAIQFSDFTATPKIGYCVDSNFNEPAWVQSPPQKYTTDVAMQNYCVRYCGQNLATTFLGFETNHDPLHPDEFFCNCVFNLPSFPDDETTPFPYQYTPFPSELGSGNGTAIADGDGKSTEARCYKYNGTPTGSASPTGVHTPAPTAAGQVGASDFTHLGNGDCLGSNGEGFSYAKSKFMPWTNQQDAAAECTSWCGQNVNANFVGFAVHYLKSVTNTYSCECKFNLPGQLPPYYGYNPTREDSDWDYGTGPMAGIRSNLTDFFCYKWNGTSGGGTLPPTKAPTKPGSGTLPPTKAPTKPGSGTLPPTNTKAPTKPGSCPVGHPSCANVADCSGSVFSHCLDGCCAGLGSKSAKNSKSSKRV